MSEVSLGFIFSDSCFAVFLLFFLGFSTTSASWTSSVFAVCASTLRPVSISSSDTCCLLASTFSVILSTFSVNELAISTNFSVIVPLSLPSTNSVILSKTSPLAPLRSVFLILLTISFAFFLICSLVKFLLPNSSLAAFISFSKA